MLVTELTLNVLRPALTRDMCNASEIRVTPIWLSGCMSVVNVYILLISPPPPPVVADDLPVLADLHLGHQNGVGIHILA